MIDIISADFDKQMLEKIENKTKHTLVMLVDDNEIDNYMNEMVIKGALFSETVFIYSCGVAAIEFFRNIKEGKFCYNKLLPTYIFVDLNMPIMNGFQFIEEFNEHYLYLKSDIKIVVLTSSKEDDDLNKALSYKNVVKFIRKPLTV
ncbi:MAG: response regulator [Bacteroidia bacterium]